MRTRAGISEKDHSVPAVTGKGGGRAYEEVPGCSLAGTGVGVGVGAGQLSVFGIQPLTGSILSLNVLK